MKVTVPVKFLENRFWSELHMSRATALVAMRLALFHNEELRRRTVDRITAMNAGIDILVDGEGGVIEADTLQYPNPVR